jgi:hypothetical protein
VTSALQLGEFEIHLLVAITRWPQPLLQKKKEAKARLWRGQNGAHRTGAPKAVPLTGAARFTPAKKTLIYIYKT